MISMSSPRPSGAEFLDASNFRHEADAARALDAPRHMRLDQWPKVFLIDGALVFIVARAADAIGHGLILQVAFAALVADRAVERVVDKQEFHDALACLLDKRRAGVDAIWVNRLSCRSQIIDAHRARGDGFRHAIDLDQAHAAVAGNRQALMIAKSRHFPTCKFAGLEQVKPSSTSISSSSMRSFLDMPVAYPRIIRRSAARQSLAGSDAL